jgi:hypothetical protein
MGAPLAALRRIAATRPAPLTDERCEMCAEAIAAEHQHVVDVESRVLMCTCRGCYLLFDHTDAVLRYRAVPDRYLEFPGFSLGHRQWDALEIPVGLAFFFQNSATGTTTAFYPGPAGAAESELPLDAWSDVLSADPRLRTLTPDVEALLIRVPGRDDLGAWPDGSGGQISCHLVPVDACYALVGRLRALWRGFDGGTEARLAIDEFFAEVAVRSRPAPGAPSP